MTPEIKQQIEERADQPGAYEGLRTLTGIAERKINPIFLSSTAIGVLVP
jgi:hypothetical protein